MSVCNNCYSLLRFVCLFPCHKLQKELDKVKEQRKNLVKSDEKGYKYVCLHCYSTFSQKIAFCKTCGNDDFTEIKD